MDVGFARFYFVARAVGQLRHHVAAVIVEGICGGVVGGSWVFGVGVGWQGQFGVYCEPVFSIKIRFVLVVTRLGRLRFVEDTVVFHFLGNWGGTYLPSPNWEPSLPRKRQDLTL